jgi:hypothetical protein
MCNICSCLAALKHLKFIVCGSYVKQIWLPLLYRDTIAVCSEIRGQSAKYFVLK